MKIAVDTYLGEAPRKTARELGQNMAQIAQNARLMTGDLEAWRQFTSDTVLPAFTPPAAVKTIYKLKDVWLQFKEQVDVARGLIPGDSNYFTFLTSPALYAVPQYTTYTLATTGAAPYPVTTRPLGVPGPDTAPTVAVSIGSTPDISASDSGDQFASWTSSGTVLTGTEVSQVRQSATTGDPAPSYELIGANNVDHPGYLYRDFGVGGNRVVQFDSTVRLQGNGAVLGSAWRVMNDSSGSGVVVGVGYTQGAAGGVFLVIGSANSWSDPGSFLEQIPIAALDGTAATSYTMKITVERQVDGKAKVTANLYNGVTLLGTAELTSLFIIGGYCGFSMVMGFNPPEIHAFHDNLAITGSGVYSDASTTSATSYVYTFVNSLGWESAPSDASVTLLRPDGAAVVVTTPTTTPVGTDPNYLITLKRIYRSISGASGDAFYLVAEIPLATATYTDELDDSAISNPGTLLESADWDLPNPAMEGIIALPNGIMAGFFLNQLCLSAVARPHAWPVKFRLPTDTNIVAIKNIDNTIVVATQAALYTATGNDPVSYTMSAPGEVQACVSKLGMTYIDGYGVVYPSPDGFQVCAGSAGNVRNATELIFEKHQWEALNPSSIRAAVHDGILFFWFDGTNPDIGYALDTKQGGFGLIRLSHHAIAAHVDPLLDSLFMILDSVSEPVEVLLPVASTAPTPTALTIFKFDGHATNRVRFLWRGRLNQMPQDTAMQYARVEALDYTNLVLRVYGNGALLYTKRVTSDRPFKVNHGGGASATLEYELVGTSTAQTSQLVQDMSEVT